MQFLEYHCAVDAASSYLIRLTAGSHLSHKFKMKACYIAANSFSDRLNQSHTACMLKRNASWSRFAAVPVNRKQGAIW